MQQGPCEETTSQDFHNDQLGSSINGDPLFMVLERVLGIVPRAVASHGQTHCFAALKAGVKDSRYLGERPTRMVKWNCFIP